MQRPKSLGYIPALDGLRAIAIVLVVAYHDSPVQVGGGFIGVDIFFTLSGYLITGLLLKEWAQQGHLDLRAFYMRRALRLLPALLAVIVFTLLATVFLVPWAASVNLGEVFASLFYVANWADMAKAGGYHILGMLNHTWSLSVEEQFYIAWPLLLLFVLRKLTRPAGVTSAAALKRLAVILTVVLCAIPLYRAVLFFVGADETRIYRGSDTRADALLLGCLLAVLLHSDRLNVRASITRGAAALSVLFIGALAFFSQPNHRFYPLGGYTLLALAVAAILWHLHMRPEGLFARVLSTRWLVGLGKVSYGLYLWHFPIFFVFAASGTFYDDWPRHLIRLAVVGIVTFLSFRYIEQPALQLKSRLASRRPAAAAQPPPPTIPAYAPAYQDTLK